MDSPMQMVHVNPTQEDRVVMAESFEIIREILFIVFMGLFVGVMVMVSKLNSMGFFKGYGF